MPHSHPTRNTHAGESSHHFIDAIQLRKVGKAAEQSVEAHRQEMARSAELARQQAAAGAPR